MKKNVLVFSSAPYPGIQICRWLHNSLLFHPIAAASYPNHAEFIVDDCICNLPFINEMNFFEELNNVIFEKRIEFIIPTDDTIALVLTENQKAVHAIIVCSPYETAKICRSKSLTYKALYGLSFVPKVYSDLGKVFENDYPLFVKPDEGQGSRGAKQIINCAELKSALDDECKMVVCEYLPGEEYTIDCFTDKNRQLLFINPRIRSRIQNGVSVRSESVRDIEEFEEIVKSVNDRIAFRGFWFIQLKRDIAGKLKLLELSTRFSGSFGHSQGYGVNLPLLALYDFADMNVSIIKNDYYVITDKSYIDRYYINYAYSRVYVDYDDTITYGDGKLVNSEIMAYLYQCRNKNCEIVLLTRHSVSKNNSLEEDMNRLAIPRNLFDRVVELTWLEEKNSVMDLEKPSIFIDNSFEERKKVSDKLKIPVFDVSHVECLYDWR